MLLSVNAGPTVAAPAKLPGTTKTMLTAVSLALFGLFLLWAQSNLDDYKIRIINLCAINVVLGVSLNLIYGFNGQFSLGHAGFMAVGAYTAALLTMPAAQKQANFFMTPLISPLDAIQWPFLPSLIAAGVVAGLFGFLIGAPALRLRGDYLGIATLGFAEIIRVVFNNIQWLTNGALGLKGIPGYTNVWWSWGIAALSIWVVVRLLGTGHGRAVVAVREDEIAAEAMGVNLFHYKIMPFVVGSFFAGVGGALLGNLITTIDPKTFGFILTFQILMIVVVGGLGSITGTVIAAILYTVSQEALRPLEAPMNLGFIQIPGIPGMRMVIFSILLLLVILFYRQGIMGTREFSWDWFVWWLGRIRRTVPRGQTGRGV